VTMKIVVRTSGFPFLETGVTVRASVGKAATENVKNRNKNKIDKVQYIISQLQERGPINAAEFYRMECPVPSISLVREALQRIVGKRVGMDTNTTAMSFNVAVAIERRVRRTI